MKTDSILRSLLACCLLLSGAATAQAQAPTCTAPDPDFHLYLLMGQSNMAGRGPLTEALQAVGHARVFMLNAQGEWVPARHPLHFDKPEMVGVGPGLAFGMAMADANPDVRIGLVPCAVGGTSIAKWQPGVYDEATKTHPYDDAVARISAAMRCGVVKGMLWHQGESDANPTGTAAYLPKLTELIGRVRALTNQPALPVVAGEVGRFKEASLLFNAQLLTLPTMVPRTAVVTSEDLTDKGDHVHFNAASADELGRRYASQMRALQQAAPAPKERRKGKSKVEAGR
ncbi:sialate O-acetylesterase [Hymenobacter terrenus]|uniref:sialate O-acetylesterase n=1 Tax=Hymenobacter terrenus TaxID=1629124 RepID=UPI0006193BCE|nr:sialate O-acetylesterase [Hymenobacter terrenus]